MPKQGKRLARGVFSSSVVAEQTGVKGKIPGFADYPSFSLAGKI
jgi:hypothetical protein